MAENSKIAWTETTWNISTGCTKIRAGCKHCYAETMSRRLRAMGQAKYQDAVNDNGKWSGKITPDWNALDLPYAWKQPRRVFVDSMSDLFHESLPFGFIDAAFDVMRATPHTYQVLTKRYDVALSFALYSLSARKPFSNVLIGFSVCNETDAKEARPFLKDIADKGWNTWVSYEPALEPIDWTGWEFIKWIVVGGESGPSARPMNIDWMRSTRQWAERNNIAYFSKQLGGHPNARRELSDFPPDLQIRQYPS